jgi:hypothetical protein
MKSRECRDYHLVFVLLLGFSGCSQPFEAPTEAPTRTHAVATDSPLAIQRGQTETAQGQPGRAQPVFRDVACDAGLTAPHYNAADGRYRLVETMGSGVGLLDYDGDGWLDIFIAQGSPLPCKPADDRCAAQLYRNNRDGTFTDVARTAGVAFEGFGQGVAVGDYDGDGCPDLYVSGFGHGALYHNKGNGSFDDVTATAGVASPGWATSCAFADLDGDGDLDLYLVHYLANTVDHRGEPTVNCNALPGAIGYCPPTAFPPEPDALYRNNGNGTFTDVSQSSGIAGVAGNGLGLAVADFDDDGKLDIFVANDKTPNLLWHNLGGLKFEEVGVAWGVAYNESGLLRAGMGVAAGDHDGDGRADLLVTNYYEEGSTLYRNAAPGRLEVVTARANLLVPSRSKLGFGTGFFDADGDGRLDLFVANGHINDVRPLGIPYAMESQLFWNMGQGRFRDVSKGAGPYFAEPLLGRGAAFGDIDCDGDIDIVVTHLARCPALLLNETAPRGRVLRLSLVGAAPARAPIGAKVTAQVGRLSLTRVVAGGTSYLSASDTQVLLGIGPAVRADRVVVRWPSGRLQSLSDVPAEIDLLIEEGREPRPRPVAKPRKVLSPPAPISSLPSSEP